MRTDIYEKITNQIVTELEKGVRPWHQPWKAEHSAGRITRPLRGNGIPYQGINVLMLWSAAIEKGYAAPIWITFKQALKGYTVFTVEQIEGLPDHYYGKPEVRTDSVRRISHAEDFFAATGANVVHGGSRACYVSSTDNIHMPCIDFFRDAESYYATRAHETCHWTRHPSRLDREFGRKRFGDEGYAMEELVAELGAAFLSADLELTPEVRDDHAAYIASWIKVLKNDKRAIFTAASHAQRAADYLNGLQNPAAQEADAA
jgi:antirestriction protein ArdC